MGHVITVLEAEDKVRKIMARAEPNKKLDPELVRWMAEVLVELFARQEREKSDEV